MHSSIAGLALGPAGRLSPLTLFTIQVDGGQQTALVLCRLALETNHT